MGPNCIFASLAIQRELFKERDKDLTLQLNKLGQV